MSSDLAIRVSAVSKAFPIYEKPIHRLLQMAAPPSRKHKWFRRFEALKNISFDVARGETLGIVGRNGSGKSTLLQIICGTLTPTTGSVSVNGRIAALLELGAGFNPEFTGRENVYLNGTLLGLDSGEIRERFDDIAAFADIGEFIEQPVKSYSSGMYVRLAFAVAINVTPDILVIDEALSVGDEAFQRKCFARIQRMRDDGTTVLFVSHSAGTVTHLCNRAILLDRGELLVEGTPKFVVSRYHKMIYAPKDREPEIRAEIRDAREDAVLTDMTGGDGIEKADAAVVNGSGRSARGDRGGLEATYDEGLAPKSTVRYALRGAEIVDPHIETLDGRRVNVLRAGEDYVYKYAVTFSENAALVRFGMLLKAITGVDLGGAVSALPGEAEDVVEAGSRYIASFRFRCLLDCGTYFLNAGVVARVGEEEVYLDRIIDAAMFRVMPDEDRLATGIVDFLVAPNVRKANVLVRS